MTYQSPRIYIYKITFEEVPYYYYGSKKEKKFDEEYWGSPVTNKWCWKLYTPKKQILELFEFSDEGYIEALEIESRLIKPVFNTDKWCLNENCGGIMSLPQKSRAGKMGGQKTYEMGVGVHGRTKEQIIEDSKIGGKIGGKISGKLTYELGIGIFGMSKEEKSEAGKRGSATIKKNKTGIFGATKEQLSQYGRKSYELGVGLHSLTAEEKTEICKNAGILVRDMKLGIFGLTEEERIKNAGKGGKVGGKVTSSQRWECIETGFISTPSGLSKYQKKRSIDTSKRIRIL
jgi:hypothetical protein